MKPRPDKARLPPAAERPALAALLPVVASLPECERVPAAERLLRYLELVIEQVDAEDGFDPRLLRGESLLTDSDEGSTLCHSV